MAGDREDERDPGGEAAPEVRLKQEGWEPYEGPRSLGRLLRLVGGAVGLLWEAAPRLVTAMVGLQLVSAIATALSLLVIQRFVGQLLVTNRAGLGLSAVLPAIGLLAAVLAVTQLASAVQNSVRELLSEKVQWLAMEQVLEVSTAVDLEAFDSSDFHDLLQRAQNAGGRPYVITQSLLNMAGSTTTLVGMIAVLFILQPLLVPTLLISVVPLAVVATRFSREFHEFNVAFTLDERKRWYLRSLMTGREMAKEVRAFGLVAFLRDLNRRSFEERMASLGALARRNLIWSILGSLLSAAAVALTIAILVGFVLGGRMSIASASAAAVAIVQVGGLLAGIAYGIATLYESSLFLEDHRVFVELLTRIAPAPRDAPAPAGFEAITVDDITFTYPDASRPALDGVSLRLRRGEVVALVGENGSGKTTLAKLLCQLYRPQSGRIYWDGTDLAAVDSSELRKQVAVVFQDFPQYFFDAAANIGIGRVEAINDRARVERAARHAGAHDFLSTLRFGYQTMLGKIFEDGADLSTGQWQRMALARAFFRDAPFIILDEPTAALDPRAEHELFASIHRLFAGRTVLLISHRFSSVVSADRIFVLKAGHLVEQGAHADLLAAGGLYAELFTLQAAAYRDPHSIY
ncbi:MAG: ABC transporter ATP-binding protein/permease [Candidatus Dormibacteraeota bacterium]|nr:ABC transporter ATP-binding protein/permease [Candidatus Dormibacteraeota bacterium]